MFSVTKIKIKQTFYSKIADLSSPPPCWNLKNVNISQQHRAQACSLGIFSLARSSPAIKMSFKFPDVLKQYMLTLNR
jgi:hypothetical protein